MAGAQSELSARLLVEGALPSIRGDASGPPIAEGRAISSNERAQFKLPMDGVAFVYAADATSNVFVHMLGPNVDIWFYGDDGVNALPAVERALKRAFPAAKQIEDMAHPKKPGLRSRSFRLDFPGDRTAFIEIVYALKAGAAENGLWIRASANERRN